MGRDQRRCWKGWDTSQGGQAEMRLCSQEKGRVHGDLTVTFQYVKGLVRKAETFYQGMLCQDKGQLF